MSYCRFSSDDWMSDVYVYESAEGWVVHVAANRPAEAIHGPDMAAFVAGRIDGEEFARQMTAMNEMLVKVERRAIEHPAAGAMRTFGSPGECAEWLVSLSETGIHVPADVVPTLRDEQDDLPRA